MSERSKNDPSTQSSAYRTMAPKWEKLRTVLDGTEALRASGKKYLPQHENESRKAYEERLRCATFLNLTALTLESWVGRPFSDILQVSDDVPEEHVVRVWMEDVDLQGNDLGVFAREWFKMGLSKGFGHVLVDFPELPEPEEGRPRTLADDEASGARPFLSLVDPENVIFAETQVIDGREVYTHVRIMEEERGRDDFEETVTQRIRVFDRDDDGTVSVSTYVKSEVTTGPSEWAIETGPRVLAYPEIPLLTFYVNRKGTALSKPPLEDLADLNIRWWQSNSDQIAVLTTARFPIISGTGVDLDPEKGDIIVIGPKKGLFSSNEKAQFGYVEHTGAAIAAGRQELVDLEDQMGHYGADFLKRRPGDVTATARALDSAEATSPLQDATIRFNDVLQRAMEMMGRWVRVEMPPKVVEVPVDFGPESIVSDDMTAVTEARKLRDLSRENYLLELQRRGSLREDLDLEENDAQLEGESLGGLLADQGTTDGDPIDDMAEE